MIVREAREQILRIDVCIVPVERIAFEKLPAALSKKMRIFSVFVVADWSTFLLLFGVLWTLVIQSDETEKMMKKMLCSKKKWDFSVFIATGLLFVVDSFLKTFRGKHGRNVS